MCILCLCLLWCAYCEDSSQSVVTSWWTGSRVADTFCLHFLEKHKQNFHLVEVFNEFCHWYQLHTNSMTWFQQIIISNHMPTMHIAPNHWTYITILGKGIFPSFWNKNLDKMFPNITLLADWSCKPIMKSCTKTVPRKIATNVSTQLICLVYL